MQKAVDVVDAVEAVVVQAQDDLVITLSLEQGLVEYGRVTVACDDLCNVVVDVTNLLPESEERRVLGPKRRRKFEDRRARNEGADDAEPVPKLNRLDLVDVTNKDKGLAPV